MGFQPDRKELMVNPIPVGKVAQSLLNVVGVGMRRKSDNLDWIVLTTFFAVMSVCRLGDLKNTQAKVIHGGEAGRRNMERVGIRKRGEMYAHGTSINAKYVEKPNKSTGKSLASGYMCTISNRPVLLKMQKGEILWRI